MNYLFSIYGESKAGRSTFAASAPGPKVVASCKGNWAHVPCEKTFVPFDDVHVPSGDAAVVVEAPGYEAVERLTQWASKTTPTKGGTFIVDNLTSAQYLRLEKIATGREPVADDWAKLSGEMRSLVLRLRDLTRRGWDVVLIIDEVGIRADKDSPPVYHPNLTGKVKQLVLGESHLLGRLVDDGSIRKLMWTKGSGFSAGTNLPLKGKNPLGLKDPSIKKIKEIINEAK